MSDCSEFRFGNWRVDPRAARLLHDGEPVTLSPQPFKLLCLLLENADRLVTREEARTLLWPDRVVEYEQGLNFCIRQLRRALDDDAGEPRFIETVPRQGFRWLPEVQVIVGPEAHAATAALPSKTAQPRRKLVLTAGLTVTALAAAAIATVLGGRLRSPSPPTDRPVHVEILRTKVTGVDVPGYVSEAFTERLGDSLADHGIEVVRGTASATDVGRVVVLSTQISAGDRELRVSAALTEGERQLWSGLFSADAMDLTLLESGLHEKIAEVVRRITVGAGNGTERVERERVIPTGPRVPEGARSRNEEPR